MALPSRRPTAPLAIGNEADPWRSFRAIHHDLPRATPFTRILIVIAFALVGAAAGFFLGLRLLIGPLHLHTGVRDTMLTVEQAALRLVVPTIAGAVIGAAGAAVYLFREGRTAAP